MIEHWDRGLQRGCKVSILGSMRNPTEPPVAAHPGLPGGWTMCSAQATYPLSHSTTLSL